MKQTILLLMVAGVATLSGVEWLPSNPTDWTPHTSVGVPGGYEQYLVGGASERTNTIDVTQSPYSADNTGASDARAAIVSAIAAATSNDVVYLPSGTYRIDSQISITKSNITVRGAGQSETIIDWRGTTGSCIVLGADSDWPHGLDGTVISTGLTKGATDLTLTSSSGFTVGNMVRLSEDNSTDPTVVHVSFPTTRVRSQLSRVTAIDGNVITVAPGLHWDFDTGNPKARVITTQVSGVGIESLRIDATNGTSPNGVFLNQAYGCWLYDLHVKKVKNYPVYMLVALNNTLAHCFLDDLLNVGPNGAGILMERSGNNLVEDNIFYRQFPHMEVNFGSTGNAFLYNFVTTNAAGSLVGFQIDSNHGPHNSYNLYEGNVCSKFGSDGYYGSASDDTAFRNWFTAYDADTTDFWVAVQLGRFTRNYNIVGNILGTTGQTYTFELTGSGGAYSTHYIYVLGYPNMGNLSSNGTTAEPSTGDWWADWGTAAGPNGFQERDLDVETSSVFLGNWNAYDEGIPTSEALGSYTLPESLAYDSKPTYFGALAWPPFDPSNPNESPEAIPAGYRYINGVDPPSTAQVRRSPSRAARTGALPFLP